jgi:transglutaminase-like putative cysteine protease
VPPCRLRRRPRRSTPRSIAETVWEHFHVDIVVAADGTAVSTYDRQAHFLTDNAARNGSHVLLGYQPGYGGVEVLEAWTLKKDGSRIAVPAGSIQTQSGRASLGAFSDSKTIQIEFPQVEAGGGIAYRYKQTETRPHFTGQFAFWSSFDDRQLWQDVRISVDAPKDYPLTVQPRDGLLADETTADRHRWRWTWRSPGERLERAEFSNVFPALYQPGLLISSLHDYGQMAAIYRDMIATHVAPTAAAQKLADQITAGVDDPQEQARRLFDWVRINVRYVQIYLGDAGWIPHDVDAILAAHFGDCKDHAALLGALLAAKGIASTPVLIGSGLNYSLPQPPYPFIFNHIITYVPLLGRYLDSTARYGSFEQLPGGDLGVPVLHIDDGSIHTTPQRSAERDRTQTFTTLEFSADGSATGTVRVLASGADTASLRGQFETIDAARRADYVSLLLLGSGLIGDGDIEVETGLPPQQYAVSLHLRISNPLNPDDAGALALQPLLRGPQRLIDIAAYGQRYKTRRHPFGCLQSAVDEHYRLHFPPGYHIDLPRPVSVSEDDYAYHSDYRREDGDIVVERHYASTVERTLCDADDYQLLHAVTSRLLDDLRKQIVYRSPSSAPRRSGRLVAP